MSTREPIVTKPAMREMAELRREVRSLEQKRVDAVERAARAEERLAASLARAERAEAAVEEAECDRDAWRDMAMRAAARDDSPSLDTPADKPSVDLLYGVPAIANF